MQPTARVQPIYGDGEKPAGRQEGSGRVGAGLDAQQRASRRQSAVTAAVPSATAHIPSGGIRVFPGGGGPFWGGSLEEEWILILVTTGYWWLQAEVL